MIYSTGISLKNNKPFNKPNEDYYLIDNNNLIYIVVDGVSRDKINGVYPQNSLSKTVSTLFTSFAYNYIKNNLQKCKNKEQLLFDAISYGNKEVNKFNTNNYEGDFLPGTVGVVSLIYNSIFYFAYIGDCLGIAISKDKIISFTEPQTAKIRIHIKEFTVSEVRNVICNNIQHPYSYGVINGSSGADNFIKTGNFSIEDFNYIYLYSDGFEKYINQQSPDRLLNLNIKNFNINNDYLSDDDKTIVQIHLKG